MKRVLSALMLVVIMLSSVAIFHVAAEEKSNNNVVLTAVYKSKDGNSHCYDLILSGASLCYLQFTVVSSTGCAVQIENAEKFDFMSGTKNIFYASADVENNGQPFARLYIESVNDNIPEPQFIDIDAYNYNEQAVRVLTSIDKSVADHLEPKENSPTPDTVPETTTKTGTDDSKTSTPAVSTTEVTTSSCKTEETSPPETTKALDTTTKAPNNETATTDSSGYETTATEIPDHETTVAEYQTGGLDVEENNISLQNILLICAGVVLMLAIICLITLLIMYLQANEE